MTEITLTHDQIATLWVQFGGPKSHADMAAAIAQAESGGRPGASNTNGNGSVDRGLFQINSIHGPASSYAIDKNIKAAILISAAGNNWRPWCTAWSDNACGTKGGTYKGSGASYHQFITGRYTPADIEWKRAADGSGVLVDSNGKNIVQGQIPQDEAGGADPQGITGGAATGIAHKALGWAEALGRLLENLLNPRFWLRVGQGLASAVLLLIGLGLVFRQDASALVPTARVASAVKNVGKASKVAEAAA